MSKASDAKAKSERWEAVAAEAKARFKRCVTYESTARTRFVEDIKFCNADAYNHWQWPGDLYNERDGNNKPTLTINKTRQHCLQIINDARQNKTSMKTRAVGDGASVEAAKVWDGIMRHIEYISNAQNAYGTATRFQVQGGIGYLRVATDYVADDSFDQEIFVRRVKDPLSIYMDPDIQEADGSDARFGFCFDDMAKDAFDKAYPHLKDSIASAALDNEDGWITEDHIRVAEYFRCVEAKDQLIAVTGEDGQQTMVRASKLGEELAKSAMDAPDARVRDLIETRVEYFMIVGDKVVEEKKWAGRYIPIVPVPGEVTVIEGELDRKGHTRALIDPQRMYNYNASAEVEYGALQSKVPWIVPAAGVEGYETYWASANTENYAYLAWNHLDDEGNPIPPPFRPQPPQSAPLYIQGMDRAAQDMMMVSGQYQAMMGAPSNEQSGKAINERQRQGDNATYHYIDHLAMAVRQVGRIVIDLAPKIYDTPRVLKILDEDGTETEINIDPQAKAAYAEQKAQAEGKVRAVFNPTMGRYDVVSDVGPAFATRRQEAFNALSQIAQHNPELMKVIGDLVFQAADFPMADEAAQRIRRTIPANILGDGPSPEVQQLTQQAQQLHQVLQQMGAELEDAHRKLKDQGIDQGVKVYESETKRISALQKALALDPEGTMAMVRQVVMQALSTSPGAMPGADPSMGALALGAPGGEQPAPQPQLQGVA